MNPSKRNESPSLRVPKTSQNVYKVLKKLEENRKKTQNSSSASKYSYTPTYTPSTTTYTPSSSSVQPYVPTYTPSTYIPSYRYNYVPTSKSKTAWTNSATPTGAPTTTPTTTTEPSTTTTRQRTDSRPSSPASSVSPSYTYENYLKRIQKQAPTTESSAVSKTEDSRSSTPITTTTATTTATSSRSQTPVISSRSQTPVISSRSQTPASSSSAKPKSRRSKSVEFGKQTVVDVPIKSSECKFEILNVSNIFNASTLKSIDNKLKASGLFDNYMSLLFVFDSSDDMEYTHYNIFYNKKSQDPDISTEAIESDKQYFTEEQLRGRTERRTRKIKESGEETRIKRNKIVLKILFLFLVKVMFYAQNNFFFLDLTKSIKDNIILCGENLPLKRGSLFYGNNLFLRKNVSITYSTNMDTLEYLNQVKQRFIELIIDLGIIEKGSSLKAFPLESVYKSILESAFTQHDNALSRVLSNYSRLIRQKQ